MSKLQPRFDAALVKLCRFWKINCVFSIFSANCLQFKKYYKH